LNDLFEVSAVVNVAFWVAAALAIGAALAVVVVPNVFKAALFLALSFTGVAAVYFLLSAEFVGVVQILVYVGAVSVLIVFAVMLVRDVGGASRPVNKQVAAGAIVVAGLVAGGIMFVAYDTRWTRVEDIGDVDAAAALGGTYRELPIVGRSREEAVLVVADADEAGAKPGVFADGTGTLGTLLVREYLLAFEVIGLVLTAALIGALALMREPRRDATSPVPPGPHKGAA
jgi:NADH:ubiquinone oxidoreductase subunit 6 (subunit J)